MNKQCSIEGCENPVIARGWCGKHYARWKTHGDPSIVAHAATHGMARNYTVTREYETWRAMNARCYNVNHAAYHLYGGKGIVVFAGWRGVDGFKNFLEHVGVKPSPEHSIDRYPDKAGNYEPGNVRWATRKEQALNTSRNNLITIDGVTKALGEWSAISGVGRDCIFHRLKAGKSPKDAVFAPSRRRA